MNTNSNTIHFSPSVFHGKLSNLCCGATAATFDIEGNKGTRSFKTREPSLISFLRDAMNEADFTGHTPRLLVQIDGRRAADGSDEILVMRTTPNHLKKRPDLADERRDFTWRSTSVPKVAPRRAA